MLAQAITQIALTAASEAEEMTIEDMQLPAIHLLLKSKPTQWSIDRWDENVYATLTLPGLAYLAEDFWSNADIYLAGAKAGGRINELVDELGIDTATWEPKTRTQGADLVLEITGFEPDWSDQIAEAQAIWQAGY